MIGCRGTYYVQFQLGTVMVLVFTGAVSAEGDLSDGPGYGGLSMHAQYNFLEADQVTPLAVEIIPEPSPAWLLSLSGILTFAVSRRLRGLGVRCVMR